MQDLDYTLSDADKIDNEITVIRRGKKKTLSDLLIYSYSHSIGVSFFLLKRAVDSNYSFRTRKTSTRLASEIITLVIDFECVIVVFDQRMALLTYPVQLFRFRWAASSR